MICLKLTLVALLLHQISSQKPEPSIRPVGRVVEMGYCFGMDYILVYRVVGGKDQLLINSSAVSPPVTPPSDLQGRIQATEHQQLLGMQIKNLNHGDSGIYRRECWRNQTLQNQNLQQLIVCDFEMKSEEIFVDPDQNERMEIFCNSSVVIGQGGVSVRWYYDTYPTYTITQLLDSRNSLDPVDGVLEVKDNGSALVIKRSMLHNNQHFYCVVYKEGQCLSYQEINVPENLESVDVFASHGDKVVLLCDEDEENTYWDTPVGKLDNMDERSHHMFISTNFSLVIPSVSEEHFGEYSCISSISEMQYSVVKCPKKQSSEKFTFENGKVTLHCDIGTSEDSYMVQWYRRQKSGEHELMFDSGDDSVPIPEDLSGRITLTKDEQLIMSNVKRADEGMYWCVVLKGMLYLEDEDYSNGEEGEEIDESDYEDTTDDSDWVRENQCLFKQETFLSVNKKSLPAPSTTTTTTKTRRNGQAETRAGVTLMVVSLATVFVLGWDR
ncbi:hypothetical protein NL108_004205 [Boleophthalmus pectinirostris]|nr:hypothetical protein NL108_004205 [Boleophthalmus pectinirostris]